MAETPADEVIERNSAPMMDAPERDDDAAIKETATPIFANYDGTNDDMAAKKGKKAPIRLNVRPAKRSKTDVWSVENLMQNTKSKLLKVNLKVSLIMWALLKNYSYVGRDSSRMTRPGPSLIRMRRRRSSACSQTPAAPTSSPSPKMASTSSTNPLS